MRLKKSYLGLKSSFSTTTAISRRLLISTIPVEAATNKLGWSMKPRTVVAKGCGFDDASHITSRSITNWIRGTEGGHRVSLHADLRGLSYPPCNLNSIQGRLVTALGESHSSQIDWVVGVA